jgi:hypothetical protein
MDARPEREHDDEEEERDPRRHVFLFPRRRLTAQAEIEGLDGDHASCDIALGRRGSVGLLDAWASSRSGFYASRGASSSEPGSSRPPDSRTRSRQLHMSCLEAVAHLAPQRPTRLNVLSVVF